MNAEIHARLASWRKQLEQEKQLLENQLNRNDEFGLRESLRDSVGELSPIDNHPGDVATELYEREKDIALLRQEERHLETINSALAAMDDATYGICKVCGADIAMERLDAEPETLTCIEHAPKAPVQDYRPVEEQFLEPPFGRSSMDENDYAGFDGEDAWQIVEQWGNSDSPALSENRNAYDYDHMGIEADENDGYVESIESFLATDITGRHVSVVRNHEYNHYLHSEEGDHELEDDY
ncbi:TraR/DksA C4-type zinc finger protein [Paenibacillus sp. HB172176]|uniref:TraR/DksA C4-type zinc finger protein n=1 Tax=Paenibacillus sp. HB172176 TaxID=2493690 RepID=UPI00143BD569|nr:TraR/DksA C4-type zinc finger protein [Paenibacillus sp. HB172176]